MWQPVYMSLPQQNFHPITPLNDPSWMIPSEWPIESHPDGWSHLEWPIQMTPMKASDVLHRLRSGFLHVGFVENSVPTCSFAKVVKVSARTWWTRGKIPFCCVTGPALFVVKFKENLWIKVIHWKGKGTQGSYIFCCVIRCQCHMMNLSSQ